MADIVKELNDTYEGLRDAVRLGSGEDKPEGVRYILISDTLAKKIQALLADAAVIISEKE